MVWNYTGFFMIKKENKKQEGFTLVETMVSVVVFTVVMSLSLGVLLVNIKTQRNALYRQRLVNETSYVLRLIENKIKNGDNITEINNSYADGLFPNKIIEVETFSTIPSPVAEGSTRVTIFIKTSIKVDEGEKIYFELQTTALKR